MMFAIRPPALAAVALTGLSLTAPAQAQQATMSFFVTSVGKGNGADLGGLAGAELTHGMVCCRVSISDMADRPPRMLSNGEVIDIGGKRLRYIDTPHVPHEWDAGVMFEETTSTLLCGDLFTQVDNGPPITDGDIVEPSIRTEDLFRYTSLGPTTGPTIRNLADLKPNVLAAMHGT